jgi:hypothetical protein
MDPHPDHVFYGNEGTDLQTVNALRLRTFSDLVHRKLNIAATLNVTRHQLLSMTKKERHRAKRVPYVVPACFRDTPSRRLAECATHFNLICLDLDEDEKTGECPAAPFVNSPEVLQEQLMPFNFAAYTTVSSTPEKPRLRIMVEAASIPVEDYRQAVDMVAYCLGLTSVTKESYVYVQPMYLPTICKGQSEDDDHPLIAYDVNGRPITAEDLILFGKKRDNRTKTGYNDDWALLGKKAGGREETSGMSLEFLRPTVEEISLEHVEAALEHLDPDMPYPEWLEIAAAMRHQFHASSNAEEAYALFDEWSAKGEKYSGSEDTRAKWNSLRPSPVGRIPITIRSLLSKAATGGWNSSVVKERCFQATIRWLQDAERTSSDLLGDGLGRILATPLITQAEEEALLNVITEACRRRWNMRMSLTALRRDLLNVKQRMAQKTQERKGPSVPGWAKGLCYVAATNEFYRHSTRERFSPEALDSTYGRKLLPTEEQLAQAGQQGSMKATSTPMIRPRDFLLNVTKIPTVYDYIYDPRSPNDTFLDVDERPYVNLYTPNYPEPMASQSLHAGELFMGHLNRLIKEPEYQRVVMDFLAYIVQYPGRKIRWAILLQGAEGCGKTFLSEAMKAVLGRGHVRTIDCNAIHSTWNDWAYGSQLISLEEIRVAGHSRHEVMNALKPLISNDVININQRHRDSRQVDNTSNYLLFTNHHDSLVLTHGDRRYFVLKSVMQTKEQVLQLGDEYFRDLFSMLKSHAAGLRHFLSHWPISRDFDADGHAPRTEYLRQLINDSANELTVAIREVIDERGHALIQPDLVSSSSLLGYLELHHPTIRPSRQQIAAVLRDEGYSKIGKHRVGNDTHYLWTKIGMEIRSQDAPQIARERLALRFGMGDPADAALLD